jgi:RNA 2',3'-cyclic 3'-phosphodiesterase
MSDETKKRLFLGLDAAAPWPESFPGGRLIDEENRHFTFIFIGEERVERLLNLIQDIPKPPFLVGPAGIFDACLPLPPRHPHLIAWKADFGKKHALLQKYQTDVSLWLKDLGLEIKAEREYLPHVTLCRHPKHIKEWKEAFKPLPVQSANLHLFESLPLSKYRSLWHLSLQPPFVELPHTADLAYQVWAEGLDELLWNAWIALAAHCPDLLRFAPNPCENLDDIIIELNSVLSRADADCGTPFKAVSFHGELIQKGPLLEWEMIIDV